MRAELVFAIRSPARLTEKGQLAVYFTFRSTKLFILLYTEIVDNNSRRNRRGTGAENSVSPRSRDKYKHSLAKKALF